VKIAIFIGINAAKREKYPFSAVRDTLAAIMPFNDISV
jgi:hypothetical protein